MDFEEFEQLVLRVLFETDVPVTAAHIAYLGRVSVRIAERTWPEWSSTEPCWCAPATDGVVEYYYPGRKPLLPRAPRARPSGRRRS